MNDNSEKKLEDYNFIGLDNFINTKFSLDNVNIQKFSLIESENIFIDLIISSNTNLVLKFLSHYYNDNDIKIINDVINSIPNFMSNDGDNFSIIASNPCDNKFKNFNLFIFLNCINPDKLLDINIITNLLYYIDQLSIIDNYNEVTKIGIDKIENIRNNMIIEDNYYSFSIDDINNNYHSIFLDNYY